MAVIITVGLPYSGKSTFIDILSGYIPLTIIRPVYEEGHDIQEWYDEINKAANLIYHGHDQHIVIDTCGATPESFNEVFTMATMRRQSIVVLYVHANVSHCAGRADSTKHDIIRAYIPKIRNAITRYKLLKHKILIVKNDKTIEELKEQAKDILESICQIDGATI